MEEFGLYYNAYLKRKSFHLFRGASPMDSEILLDLEDQKTKLVSLYPEIKTEIRIVSASDVDKARSLNVKLIA